MANIAIFRINYKSDFSLTLNSDAGWMTPFCIKFWTGAPSQAYFASFDGTTYTHCAPVEGEPTKLQVQFDDHHLPIGDLQFQIGYHFTVADFPTSVEDEVLNQASVIIEVDGEPAQVMLDLNGETAPEIEFSLPAYANEAQRIANEQERIAAEEARIQNEETRISAEQARQTNETQRIEREQARQTNETQRIEREQARQTNETQRIEREQARQTNEEQRIANETGRVTEFAGIKTEAVAATNAANAAASLANEKAEYAQLQGDYAKEQGDTALADHERAEADHTTAAADHTQAVADHTQAASDHTRAEEDHSTASADHTTATSDHTQAGQDHTTAAADHTQAEQDHTRAESDHTRAESDHTAVEVYVDSLGAFDISAYHATGGVLAKYADLAAALDSNNGGGVPQSLQKGGMSVKFVQSSDNKYIQARLMANAFTTDVTQWQGVDVSPIAESKNLVESGGAFQNIKDVETSVYSFPLIKTSTINKYQGVINSSGKWIGVNASNYHFIIPCKEGDSVEIYNSTSGAEYFAFLQSYSFNIKVNESLDIAGSLQGITATTRRTYTAPAGTKYIVYPLLHSGSDVSPAIFKINGYDYVTAIQDKLNEILDSFESIKLKIENTFLSYGSTKLVNIPTYNGGISAAGKWNSVGSTYKFSYIPIKEGDVLTVKGNASSNYLAAFMNSYQVPVLNDNVDKNGDYIQVASNKARTYTAPSGTVCLLLLRLVSNVDATPVSLSINGYDYAYSLQEKLARDEALLTAVHNITVDVNGSGDYTSLRDCFSAIGNILGKASPSRPEGQSEWVDATDKTYEVFNVYIKPGTYDVRSYFTNEEWADENTIGLIVPRGVNLIGTGKKKEDVVITCTSESASSRISLLNIQNDVTIKNLTLSANNVRYVVHDDYSNLTYANAYGDIRNLENVRLIGEHLSYNSIWGAGTKGGANWSFVNCVFINKDKASCFSVHDRSESGSQTKGETFKFKNCSFQGTTENNVANVRFLPMLGACDENVSIDSCIFNSIGIDTNVVSGMTPTTIYTIRGSGNTRGYTFIYDSAHGCLSAPKFADECKLGLNSGTDNIVFSDYVLINGNSIEKGTSENYDAISLESIEVGEYGLVRLKS